MVFLGGILVEYSSLEAGNLNKHSRKDLIYPVLGGVALGVGSIMRKYALIQFDAPVLGVAVAYTTSLLPFLVMLVFSASTRRVVVEAGYAPVLGCRCWASYYVDAEFLCFKFR